MSQATIVVRRARSVDLDSFTAFLGRLSVASSNRRFFTPVPRIPLHLARRLLRSDLDCGAWVTLHRDSVIGHGMWTRITASTAEIALVVDDRFQSRGVGRGLAIAVIHDATTSGIGQLQMIVQPDNRPVVAAIGRTWPQMDATLVDGLLAIHVALVRDENDTGSYAPEPGHHRLRQDRPTRTSEGLCSYDTSRSLKVDTAAP